MEINKEYIFITIEWLEKICEDRNTKECLKKEIKLLKEHIDAYRERYLTSSNTYEYKGIEDLVVTEETKLCVKETQLDLIEKDRQFIDLYLTKIKREYKEIIELRYLNESNRIYSYAEISKELNISESTASRRCLAAIKEIAYRKFGRKSI